MVHLARQPATCFDSLRDSQFPIWAFLTLPVDFALREPSGDDAFLGIERGHHIMRSDAIALVSAGAGASLAIAIIANTDTSGGNLARRELGIHSMSRDSYFAKLLVGGQINSVLVDSEVTYIMLTDGTQITIQGLVAVQPKPCESALSAST